MVAEHSPPAKRLKTMASNGAATIADMEIDEDLHSRQLAVYGRESMRRMAASSILIVGLNGLGVEVGVFLDLLRAAMSPPCDIFTRHPTPHALIADIRAAKNIILAGVKRVVLHDSEDVRISDLGANFNLSETDVGRNRVDACLEKLRELNTAVAVESTAGTLDDAHLAAVDVRITIL